MNTIIFKVTGNRMTRVGGFDPVSGEKNYTEFRFEFDQEWYGVQSVTVTMFFDVRNPVNVHADLNEDGVATCKIGEELRNKSGVMWVGVCGFNIRTQSTIDCYLTPVPIGEGTKVTEVATTALYQQIVEYIGSIEEKFPLTTKNIQDLAVTREKIAVGAVGPKQLDRDYLEKAVYSAGIESYVGLFNAITPINNGGTIVFANVNLNTGAGYITGWCDVLGVKTDTGVKIYLRSLNTDLCWSVYKPDGVEQYVAYKITIDSLKKSYTAKGSEITSFEELRDTVGFMDRGGTVGVVRLDIQKDGYQSVAGDFLAVGFNEVINLMALNKTEHWSISGIGTDALKVEKADVVEDGSVGPEKLKETYWKHHERTVRTYADLAEMVNAETGYNNIFHVAFSGLSPIKAIVGDDAFIAVRNTEKESLLLINAYNGEIWRYVVGYDEVTRVSINADDLEKLIIDSSRLGTGAIDKESLFSNEMIAKYLSLPVTKASCSGSFSDDFYNGLTTQGIYQISSQAGERQTLIVFKPDSDYYLMQLRLGHNKLDYRSCYTDVANNYFSDCWTEWVDLVGDAEKAVETVEHVGAKIISGEIKSIVLIGDSITDGYGGTGYNGSASTTKFSTNTSGYCWANAFKKLVEARYGIPVVNRGIWGSYADYQTEQVQKVITENDFVIWLSGTNNRIMLTDYRSNLAGYIQSVKAQSAGVLFISNIPCAASSDAGTTPHGTMRHIDEEALKAARANNVPFLSLYKEYIKYCETYGVELESTLSDGVHPTDTGYFIMFKVLCEKLGIPLSPYVDYSVQGDWWSNVSAVLDTGYGETGTGFDEMAYPTVPIFVMAGYDSVNNKTALSGKTIQRVEFSGADFQAGGLYVSPAYLNKLGTGTDIIKIVDTSRINYFDVSEAGIIDFSEEGGFVIPENMTLAFGMRATKTPDTARLCYASGATNDNWCITADTWNSFTSETKPEIRLIAKIYYTD